MFLKACTNMGILEGREEAAHLSAIEGIERPYFGLFYGIRENGPPQFGHLSDVTKPK
jgi:hypothetical protein